MVSGGWYRQTPSSRRFLLRLALLVAPAVDACLRTPPPCAAAALPPRLHSPARPGAARRLMCLRGGREGGDDEAALDGGRGRSATINYTHPTAPASDAGDGAGEASADSASLVQLSADVGDGEGIEAYLRDQFTTGAQDTEESSAHDSTTSSPDGGARGRRSPGARTDRSPRKRERRAYGSVDASASTTATPGSEAERAPESVGGSRPAAAQPDESSSASDSSEQAAAERRKRQKVVQTRTTTEDKAPEYRDTRPMICKEFAERGTCRYGLTCIFLHDRSAYYDNWKEKVRAERRRARLAARAASRISQHCPICKDRYTEPVATECNHYFCSSCILERYDAADDAADAAYAAPGGGGRTCPVCNAALSGSFQLVYDLQDKLNKQLQPNHSSVSPACFCVRFPVVRPPSLLAPLEPAN